MSVKPKADQIIRNATSAGLSDRTSDRTSDGINDGINDVISDGVSVAGDALIVDTTFRLLRARAPTSTICPSDVARALAPGDEPAWRALMPEVRRVAAALVREGRLRATRGGVDVDALAPGGPIRLARP
jgi:hypothetical protein